MINTIVNYLIKTTIEETTEGNWIFEIKNLEKMFNFTFTNEDIRNIIDEIKSLSLSGKVILGCTHYPLIKNIIKHYANADILSYENEFISKLKQDETLTFKVRCYEKEILEKYFNDLNISLYELA